MKTKYAALFLASILLGCSAAPDRSGLNLRLSLDSETYAVGQPILYAVALTNDSKRPIAGLYPINPEESGFGIAVFREPDETDLQTHGSVRDVFYRGPDMTLRPGSCLFTWANLLDEYGEGETRGQSPSLPPGRYRATFVYAPTRDISLHSNEVTFIVTPNATGTRSGAYADSVIRESHGSLSDLLRENTNTSIFVTLLQIWPSLINTNVTELLESIDGPGAAIRRAALIDTAIERGTLDVAEARLLVDSLHVDPNSPERQAIKSWSERVAQSFTLPGR